MTEAFRYLFTFLLGAAIGALVVFLRSGEFTPREKKDLEYIRGVVERNYQPVQDALAQEIADMNPGFNVTGKPRRAPWNQRRKELEAAARTKRKQIESFQEFI